MGRAPSGAPALFIGLVVVQQALEVLTTYFGERIGWAAVWRCAPPAPRGTR